MDQAPFAKVFGAGFSKFPPGEQPYDVGPGTSFRPRNQPNPVCDEGKSRTPLSAFCLAQIRDQRPRFPMRKTVLTFSFLKLIIDRK